MALTKTQKLYVGVLGITLCVLGVDKLFLLPPAAEAARPATTDTAALIPEPRIPATVDAAEDHVSIADRLEQLAVDDISQIEDAFEPTANFSPPLEKSDSAQETVNKAEAFANTHRLSAVVGAGEHGVAMVNGTPLRQGEQIGGFRLVQIRHRSVLLAAGDAQIELSLQSVQPAP